MAKKAQNTDLHDNVIKIKMWLKFTTVMFSAKMAVFRTTSVTESVEKLYRTRGT